MNSLTLKDPEVLVVLDPTNQALFKLWKLNIKEHRTKVQEYANFRAGLYNLVFGQCTDALQDCLKSHEDFVDADQDQIALFVVI